MTHKPSLSNIIETQSEFQDGANSDQKYREGNLPLDPAALCMLFKSSDKATGWDEKEWNSTPFCLGVMSDFYLHRKKKNNKPRIASGH